MTALDKLNNPDLEGAINRFGEAAMRVKAERDLLASALREIIAINDESAGACRKRMGTRRGNSIVTAQEALARIAS